MTTEKKQTNDRADLYAALVEAQRTANAVQKASRNEFHKYRYASAEDMIEEARGALHSAGLAVITTGWACAWGPAPTTGTTRTGATTVDYLLVHAASGNDLHFTCTTATIAEKGRPEDKAEATALTYSLGYFLRGLLCLPRSDENATAVDARDDRGYSPAAAHTPPKRPAFAPEPRNGGAGDSPEDAAQAFVEWLAVATTAARVDDIATRIKAAHLPADLLPPLREAVAAARARLAPTHAREPGEEG